MKQRRVEFLLMLAMLFAINAFMLLWLQAHPIPAVWASALGAPAAAPQVASIPSTFSYQGTLRDTNGNLINATVKLTLRLYSVVTGGNALYTESFTNVNVRAGVFSVVVGDTITPIPAGVFSNFPLYLGISVNQDAEMLPRQRLHPVPYAMQATTAQSAVTADNLALGGGVPNLVTIGAGGVSEIAFAPNGGKVTNDANGLTLNGGANISVTTAGGLTVGGNLRVAGNWDVNAIQDIGDSHGGANQRSSYPVSLKRYVVEAKDGGAGPNTVPLDDTILTQLCQDQDGCKLYLYVRDWDLLAHKPGLLAGSGGSFRLSLAAPANGQREWDLRDLADNFYGGIDNNGVVNHGINLTNACFFTDSEFVNGQGSDAKLGFGLLNWFGVLDSTSMTCVLIIED